MDVLEPWPLKIVFDNVIGSKKMPAILANLVSNTTGDNKPAILEFAVVGVVAIAVTGAIASYIQKYLTTKVGQQVMHDLRHILYHHIQRLSLSYYEQQKTGDLIVRITSDIDAVQDFVSSALLGIVIDNSDASRHALRDVLSRLGLHSDCVVRGADPLLRRLQLYAPNQEGHAGS